MRTPDFRNLVFASEKVKGVHEVFFHNGVKLGEAVVNDDGYYVFFFENQKNGFWSSEPLIAIGQKLQELNEPWDREVKAYFQTEKSMSRRKGKRT